MSDHSESATTALNDEELTNAELLMLGRLVATLEAASTVLAEKLGADGLALICEGVATEIAGNAGGVVRSGNLWAFTHDRLDQEATVLAGMTAFEPPSKERIRTLIQAQVFTNTPHAIFEFNEHLVVDVSELKSAEDYVFVTDVTFIGFDKLLNMIFRGENNDQIYCVSPAMTVVEMRGIAEMAPEMLAPAIPPI